MGEGFINWGYIVVEKNSMLDMKGLSSSMPRVFDYPGDIVNGGVIMCHRGGRAAAVVAV